MPARVRHSFASADGMWEVSLTRGFLALTSKKYERWEKFQNILNEPLCALCRIYQPAFFGRIGLRYRNVVRKASYGLENLEWPRLLNEHLCGSLATELASSIQHVAGEILIDLGANSGRVRILHGFLIDEAGGSAYQIDTDFFAEPRTECGDGVRILDSFNEEARRLFRWCISDRLHDALEPEPVPDRAAYTER